MCASKFKGCKGYLHKLTSLTVTFPPACLKRFFYKKTESSGVHVKDHWIYAVRCL